MAKSFWSKWEYCLWLSDRKLGMCAPATRGIWVDAISAMMEASTDRLSGTPKQLAQICRCSVDELLEAVDDLQKNDAADVAKQRDSIILVNRKRAREHNISKLRSLAGSAGGTKSSAKVTQTSNSNSFSNFFQWYPRKVSRQDAAKAWMQVDGDSHYDEIMLALKWQRETADWKKDGGKFVPYPATYLRARRWEDEPPSRDSEPLDYAP